MKFINILMELFLLHLLSGCTSVYSIKNFTTKDKYYHSFNEFAEGREAKVKLNNDTVLNISGALIENDTLYSLEHTVTGLNMKIPLSEIKEINYSNNSFTSAFILLNNGKSLKATEMKNLGDSLGFFAEYKSHEKKNIAPIDKVKEIKYYSHWGNIGAKIAAATLGGAIIGFTAGAIADHNNNSSNTNRPDGSNQGGGSIDELVLLILGAPAGAILGTVWGYISGYNYVYKYNPK